MNKGKGRKQETAHQLEIPARQDKILAT